MGATFGKRKEVRALFDPPGGDTETWRCTAVYNVSLPRGENKGTPRSVWPVRSQGRLFDPDSR